jgi:hypothetical protein
MERERQIELMNSVEERTESYLRAAISRIPKLKALLHRDQKGNGDKREPTRKRVSA